MIKLVTFLSRRSGMTTAEFRDYYEANHARIGEKYLAGKAIRYVRRYLDPLPNPLTGEIDEGGCDVVMEIWFEDRATFEATMAQFTDPDIAAEIAEDEEQVFDRSKNRSFLIEDEQESQV